VKIRLADLADKIGAELLGPYAELEMTGVAGLDHAGPGDVTFVDTADLLEKARSAGAVIVPPEVERCDKPALRAAHPRLAFARVLALFAPEVSVEPGVHPTAVLGRDVDIADGVSIGALCFIGDRARVGKGTVIHPLVYVGEGVKIAEHTTIFPNVTIYHRTEIGSRVIIHSGAVIGADGFGFTQVDGKRHKIPQIGTVIIGDDVEVGACVCIDRATTAQTVIGRGTKIDNLVQIAHNVRVGEDCVMAALGGIAGSSIVGNRVTMAAGAGVADHVTVGDDAILGALAAAISNVPAGAHFSGMPARHHEKFLRAQAAHLRLPHLVEQVRALSQKVKALEEAMSKPR